jgi:hypothetical protein
MSARHVRVSIDRLVLDGMPAHQATAIALELQQSLQRLLSDSSIAAELGPSRTQERLAGRLAPVSGSADGQAGIGASSAQRIVDGLRR